MPESGAGACWESAIAVGICEEDSDAKPDAALPQALELGRKIKVLVTGQDVTPAGGRTAGTEESPLLGHKGPWGEIEYVPIVFGPSLEYILAMMADRSGQAK